MEQSTCAKRKRFMLWSNSSFSFHFLIFEFQNSKWQICLELETTIVDSYSIMVLPPPPCVFCTLQNGFFISEDDASLKELVNLTDRFKSATCQKNFQCVRFANVTDVLPNLGCCYPCSHEQACTEATISRNHPFTDNICPGGHLCDPLPKPCSVGEMCFKNTRLNCNTIQLESKEIGFGNIFDGMFCEEGTSVMTNCPTGYYCPSANTKLLCPSQYFCPMKTKVPQIECKMCDAGSIQRFRNNSYPILMIFFIVIGFFSSNIILMYLRRWRKVDKPQHEDDNTTLVHTRNENSCFRFSERLPSCDDQELGNLVIEIRYDNLSLVVPDHSSSRLKVGATVKRKRVLNNITVELRPSRLVGVFGPSGSGMFHFIQSNSLYFCYTLLISTTSTSIKR